MNIITPITSAASGLYPPATQAILDASENWAMFLAKQEQFCAKSTSVLNALMVDLPPSAVAVCLKQLQTALKQTDPVSFEKHSLGVWFTMSRVLGLMKDGKETLNADQGKFYVDNPDELTFEAYKGNDGIPVHRKIIIEDNFTIFRNGKPFIYKAKYQPARRFGSVETYTFNETAGHDARHKKEHYAYHDHNLLLKYQAAIDYGLIAGAAVEIRGLIDLKFLEWACGTNVFHDGAVPDVQIIYNMMLPSGAEYRFTLKKSAELGGDLAVENNRHSYTSEDLEVIRGIEIALENPSQHEIYEIVSGTDVFKPTMGLTKYFNANAGITYDKIKDMALYEEYIRLSRQGIWERARAIKPERYNLNDNTLFVAKNIGVENDYERLSAVVENYQEFLRTHPDIAKVKANYVLGEKGSHTYEKNKARVMEVFAKNLSLIRANELSRRNAPEYKALDRQRKEMGWKGPDEGIGLSLDHIMFDSIAEVMARDDPGKKGRSYEDAARFMTIDEVMDYLDEEKDRQVFQIQCHDPLAQKLVPSRKKLSTYYRDETAEKLQRLQKDQKLENIKRALEYLEGPGRKLPSERKAWQAASADIAVLRRRLSGAKADIQELVSAVNAERKRLKGKKLPDDNPVIQKQKAGFQTIDTIEDLLWKRLEPIFDDGTKRKLFAQVFYRKENIMKFIYAIRSDNTIVFSEEARGSAAGLRASHSELVGGEFCYGAGEIVFSRNNVQNRWLLKEINNGSGHYRPPTQSLAFTANCLLSTLSDYYIRHGVPGNEAIGAVEAMVSKSRLTDAIARGRHLRDAEVGLTSSRILELFRGNPSSPMRDLSRAPS